MVGVVLAIMASVAVMAFSAGEAKADTALTSWYGPGFAGNPTASGEIYDPYGYTAAHKTLPLGTELVVSYGGNSVNVVVNDRGPYIEGRELDLSQGAAEYLGLTRAGVDYVDYYVSGQGYTGEGSVTSEQSAVSEQSTGSVSTQSTNVGSGGYVTSQSYVSSESTVYESSGGSSGGGVAYSEASSNTDVSVSQNVVSSDGGGSGAHIVQSGETLSELSGSLGVSVDHLASVNGIYDVDHILSGQTLYF